MHQEAQSVVQVAKGGVENAIALGDEAAEQKRILYTGYGCIEDVLESLDNRMKKSAWEF